MCGRFTLISDAETLARHFQLPAVPAGLMPRYNIAPGQDVAIVRQVNGIGRVLDHVRWGLVPSWTRDASIGQRLVNARAETAAAKPSFRAAFRSRRCLVPANGFYEWRVTPHGKQPYWIGREDGTPMALAGLWEHWDRPDGHGVLETCVLLTIQANEAMASIHARMPVILAPAHYADWLDPQADRPGLQALVEDNTQVGLVHYPVSTEVNSPLKDNPDLLRRIEI